MFEWHQIRTQVVEPEVLVVTLRVAFSSPGNPSGGACERAVQLAQDDIGAVPVI
jgi:hypothetical protein